MGAPGLARLRRVGRRGLPLILVVASVAAAIGLTSVAGRTAANETVEVPVESAPVIEPPAPRRTTLREETARPIEGPRAPTRAIAGPTGRGTDQARAARTLAAERMVATEPARIPGRPSVPEPSRATPPAVTASEPAAKAVPAEPRASSESLLGVGAKLLLGSLLLAGLLYGAARLLRGMPLAKLLPGADGPIKVIGRTHLGPKTSLALVQADGVTILVALSATGIQALHTWGGSVTGAGASSLDYQQDKGTRGIPPTPTVPGQLRNLEGRIGGRTV